MRKDKVLEQLLAKIDEDLAKNDIESAGENPAVQEILSKVGTTNLNDYIFAPKYQVPKGCPPIDLEVITSSRTLYIIVNCTNGLTAAQITNSIRSLAAAKSKVNASTHLCIYFMNYTKDNRIFIEQHRKALNRHGVMTAYSSSPLPEASKNNSEHL